MTERIIAYFIVAAIGLAVGWTIKGWEQDSVNLAVERATKKIADDATARDSSIAKTVQDKLATLTANQTVIDRGIIREVQKPIYQRVCLEPDAIRLLNAAARGEAPDDSGKSAGQVPGRAAAAD